MPLRAGMVRWPGDPEVRIQQVADMAAGDVCNLTHIDMSAHTGTHMDAPRHFTADGVSMSAWKAEDTVGRCRVVEISDPVAIRAEEVMACAPRAGEILLFKTRNSALTGEGFCEEFVYLAADAARVLAEARVRTVGIDYLSIGGFANDLVETHVIVLGAGIWVIEGLCLAGVAAGEYELCCLPLKIEGADGAPARALLRKI